MDPWADAYTLNTVEAMSYALNYDAQGDPDILAAQAAFRTNLADWIPLILSAQKSDGYLHTYPALRGLGSRPTTPIMKATWAVTLLKPAWRII